MLLNWYYVSIILKVKRKATEEEPKPKPTKAKTKCKKPPFKLHKKFIIKIKNDEKNVNGQTFKEYFFNHSHYFYQKSCIIAIKM